MTSSDFMYIYFIFLFVCFPDGGPAVLTNYTAVEEAMLALIEAFIISGLPGSMKMRQK